MQSIDGVKLLASVWSWITSKSISIEGMNDYIDVKDNWWSTYGRYWAGNENVWWVNDGSRHDTCRDRNLRRWRWPKEASRRASYQIGPDCLIDHPSSVWPGPTVWRADQHWNCPRKWSVHSTWYFSVYFQHHFLILLPW